MRDHIHQYKRTKLGKSIIYKCSMPDCSHFIQKALLEGRKSLCYRCGFPFIITKKIIKYCGAFPHCSNCYGVTNKDKKQDIALESAIEKLIGE